MIEKPTDIELANAHRYREKMEGSSEPDAVIDIYARALEWAEETIKDLMALRTGVAQELRGYTREDEAYVSAIKRLLADCNRLDQENKEHIRMRVEHLTRAMKAEEANKIEKSGAYTPKLPPDNPTPPSERTKPIGRIVPMDPTTMIDTRDLEALRYQIAGQKAALEDRGDMIDEIRKTAGCPPGASLIEIVSRQAAHSDTLSQEKLDRKGGYVNLKAAILKVGEILGQAQDENIILVAQDHMARLAHLEALVSSIKTAAKCESEEEIAPLIIAFQAKGDQSDKDQRTLFKIHAILRGDLGDTFIETATRVMADLAAKEKEIIEAWDVLCGKDKESLSDVAVRVRKERDDLEEFCVGFRKSNNCPVCHGIHNHGKDCAFAALVVESKESQAK